MPETWEEFLQAASRKVNASRSAILKVETLDTGTVLEELDEIMHGDKLVIRCSVSSDSTGSSYAAFSRCATPRRTACRRALHIPALHIFHIPPLHIPPAVAPTDDDRDWYT